MSSLTRTVISGLALILLAATSACVGAKPQTSPQAVLGITWQWIATTTPQETVKATEPERYTIMLDEERLVARFDCNRGGGQYTLEEGTLSFGMLMATRMMCPPDSQDMLFMRDLERVATFRVQDGVLHLGFAGDGGEMQFRPLP